MNLTFRGFLQQYCQELTGLQTTSLKKLCQAAATDAPRAAEPLFLLAVKEGRVPYLVRAAAGTPLESRYERWAGLLSASKSLDAMLDDPCTPLRLRKVRAAYESKRDAVLADRKISARMREKTLASMERRGLTAYRICSDLGLNLGNVYAYLGKGDVTKVSRNTARAIMEYADG